MHLPHREYRRNDLTSGELMLELEQKTTKSWQQIGWYKSFLKRLSIMLDKQLEIT